MLSNGTIVILNLTIVAVVSSMVPSSINVLNSEICRVTRSGDISPASYVTFTQIQRHGFVSSPPSRVYMCQSGRNVNCGSVQWEPQSVEARKGFPKQGPADGHIVGGGKFPKVDEAGANRWVKIKIDDYLQKLNETHVVLKLTWTYTAKHRTSAYHLFGTVQNYDIEAPLKRESLKHLDTVNIICIV